jgi:hypothetical protein
LLAVTLDDEVERAAGHDYRASLNSGVDLFADHQMGSGSIGSIMAGVGSLKWRGSASITKSYTKSVR